MRITGQGIWGGLPIAMSIRTLKSLPSLGVNFIDAADSYGPNIAEDLICRLLHPYKGMLVACKKPDSRQELIDRWTPWDAPEYLIQQASAESVSGSVWR